MTDVVFLCPEKTRPSFHLYVRNLLPLLVSEGGGRCGSLSCKIFDVNELRDAARCDQKLLYNFKVFTSGTAALVARCKAENIPIIFEIDDNYCVLEFIDGVPIHHAHTDTFFVDMLRTADLVLVYSRMAYTHFSKYAERILLLPTYQEKRIRQLEAQDTRNITIGFMGSLKKDIDFAPVVPALLRLFSDNPSYRAEFFGFIPDQLKRHPSVIHFPFNTDYDAFIDAWKERKWTIALAPLHDTDFNRSKTNTKYREYASVGFPGIYSDIPPYSDSIAHEKTGILTENTPEAWFASMSMLIKNLPLREEIRKNALSDIVKNYTVEKYVSIKRNIIDIMLTKNWQCAIDAMVCEQKTSEYDAPTHDSNNGGNSARRLKTSLSGAISPKIVIYTAVFGGYDVPHGPSVTSEDVRYVCITDRPGENYGVWEIIDYASIAPQEYLDLAPARKNRFVKWNPHILFPKIEYSLYIDSSIDIINNIPYNKINYFIDKNILISAPKHNYRNCIYDECNIIKISNKDSKYVIDEWIDILQSEKYPKNNGLFECGVLFRKHNDSLIIHFDSSVWDNISAYSHRDQISVPYFAKKYALVIHDWNELSPIDSVHRRINGFFIYPHKNECESYFFHYYTAYEEVRRSHDRVLRTRRLLDDLFIPYEPLNRLTGRVARKICRIARGAHAIARIPMMPPAASRLKILCVVSEIAPSSQSRIQLPMRLLERSHGVSFRMMPGRAVFAEDLLWADIVVFQRNNEPFDTALLRVAQKFGKPTLYDIDDNLFAVPPSLNKHYSVPSVRNRMRWFLQNADTVNAATLELGKALARLTSKPIITIPPTNPEELYAPVRHSSDGITRFLCVTTRAKSSYFSAIAGKAVARILQQYGKRVHFTFMGGMMHGIDPHACNVRFIPHMLLDPFMAVYTGLTADAALACLDDTPFTRCKTNLKFREYGARGLAGIYSNMPVYADCVKHGVTGLLAENTTEAWYEAMRELIENPGKTRAMGLAAREFAESHYRMQHYAEAFFAVIQDIVRQKPATLSVQPLVRVLCHIYLECERVALLRRMARIAKRTLAGLWARVRWRSGKTAP